MAIDEIGRQETEAEPRRKPVWPSILLITFGWAIGWAIAVIGGAAVLLIGFGAIDEGIGWAIGGAIGGTIGGLITGLALRWTQPSLRWGHVLAVTIGWAIGLAIGGAIGVIGGSIAVIGWAIGGAIGEGIGWAIGGAVGGGVTLWQLGQARRRAAVAGQGK
jgi:hypothetical protein